MDQPYKTHEIGEPTLKFALRLLDTHLGYYLSGKESSTYYDGLKDMLDIVTSENGLALHRGADGLHYLVVHETINGSDPDSLKSITRSSIISGKDSVKNTSTMTEE